MSPAMMGFDTALILSAIESFAPRGRPDGWALRGPASAQEHRWVPGFPKKSERALIKRERKSSPEDWSGEKTVARRY
jgi:hypothetical protein